MPRQCGTQRDAGRSGQSLDVQALSGAERSITSRSELVVERQADYSVINNRHARRTGGLPATRVPSSTKRFRVAPRAFLHANDPRARELVGQNCTRV